MAFYAAAAAATRRPRKPIVNWRSALHALFAWAARQKTIEANPVDAVAKPRVIRPAPAIWNPAELERLLRAAPPALVPGLVLQAFSGLRTAELLRLEWREVDLPGALVTVAATKSKTAARRLVTISPNPAEWLAPYAGATGLVWRVDGAPTMMTSRSFAAGNSRSNGDPTPCAIVLPHHLAHHRNAAAMALELGHISASMTFAHYREVVTAEAGAELLGDPATMRASRPRFAKLLSGMPRMRRMRPPYARLPSPIAGSRLWEDLVKKARTSRRVRRRYPSQGNAVRGR